VFEAFIGAVFVDQGMDVVKDILKAILFRGEGEGGCFACPSSLES